MSLLSEIADELDAVELRSIPLDEMSREQVGRHLRVLFPEPEDWTDTVRRLEAMSVEVQGER
jgi:hypothetical protein